MQKSNKANKALFKAAESGDLKKLKEALADGADVNAATDIYLDQEETPLFVAANRQHFDCVAALLEAGADVHVRTTCSQSGHRDGGTVLHSLLLPESADKRILKLLLDAGAEIDAARKSGETAMGVAANSRNIDCVKMLLDRGSKAHLVAGIRQTVMEEAAGAGELELVKLLLKNGAPADILDDFGKSPLIAACRDGHADVVDLLLKHGASVHTVDALGRTPLHHACEFGDGSRSDEMRDTAIAILESLLKAGAKIDVKNNDGQIPADYLQDKYAEPVAEWLKKWKK